MIASNALGPRVTEPTMFGDTRTGRSQHRPGHQSAVAYATARIGQMGGRHSLASFGGRYRVYVSCSVLPWKAAAAARFRRRGDLPLSELARVFHVCPHFVLHVHGSGRAGPLEVSEAGMGARGWAMPHHRGRCGVRGCLRQRVFRGEVSEPASESRQELLTRSPSRRPMTMGVRQWLAIAILSRAVTSRE